MIKAFAKATVSLEDSNGDITELRFSEIEKLIYEVEKREISPLYMDGTRCYEPTGRRTITIFGTVESTAEKKDD